MSKVTIVAIKFLSVLIFIGLPTRALSQDTSSVHRLRFGVELSSVQLLVAWLGLPPLFLPADDYSFTIPIVAFPVEMELNKSISGFLSPTYIVSGMGVGHNTPGVDSRLLIHYTGLTCGAQIGRFVRLGAVFLYPKVSTSSLYPEWISSVNSMYSKKLYVGLMGSLGYSGDSFYAGLQISDRLSPDPKGVFLSRCYLSVGVGYYFLSVR